MNKSISRPIVALSLTAVLSLTACGGGDAKSETSPAASATSAASEATVASSTPAAETTPAAEQTTPAADASASESPAAEASSDGKGIVRESYGYAIPKGWTDQTQRGKAAGLDSAIANSTDTDGFADNLNVNITPSVGKLDLADVEKAVKQELEKSGKAKNVKTGPRATLGGEEAATQTATFTEGGVSYKVRQIIAIKDGDAHIVTCSYNGDDAKAEALFQPILDSWQWK